MSWPLVPWPMAYRTGIDPVFFCPTQQQRPCQRCIKRNIGHLCHDEPRDFPSNSKKAKSVLAPSVADESDARSDMRRTSREQQAASMRCPSSFDNSGLDAAASGPGQAGKTSFDASALGRGNPLQLVQPSPVSGIQADASASANTIASSMNQCTSPNPPRPLHTTGG